MTGGCCGGGGVHASIRGGEAVGCICGVVCCGCVLWLCVVLVLEVVIMSNPHQRFGSCGRWRWYGRKL